MAESSVSIAEFARRIGRERTTVYDIFERKSIDIDLLIAISKALDYDFINEVYFAKKSETSKMLITIEIEAGEVKDVRMNYEL